MNYTAFIFARGGSKGVRNKNIHPIAGKPLIAHSIDCALKSNSVSRVVVSTDDDAIASAAKEYGAEVLKRPAELATDNAPEILAWRHAIDSFPALFHGENAQPFISLPATSPLRAPQDVDAAIARFKKGDCDMVFSITPSHRSPYFNMVTIDQEHMLHLGIAGSSATRRQDTPEMFDITTCVYVGNPAYIKACNKLIDGRVGYIMIPPERALDIDTHYDIHLAELLLQHPFKPK